MHDVTPTAATLPRAHTGEHEGDAAAMLGRYLVLGLLGRGGMGAVYSGYDPQLRRRVALKRINRRGADEHTRARSLREAQALARLAHPNIVTVYEAFEVDHELCIAMEFVAGTTLRVWLAETRPSRAEIIAALIQAGRGIAAAHAAGLVHRDLKPDNIMRGDDGRVRVMDFGLARAVDERQDELEFASTGPSPPAPLVGRVTYTGTFVGTPGYAAPEQDLGIATDARSDIFSFCVLAFEALHGLRPFVGDNDSDVLAATLAGRIVDVPDDKVPAWLDAVIRRGLAVEPDARWPTMDALLAALADDPLARARRRRRVLAWFMLAAVVVAGATYGVSLLRESLERSRREAAAATRLAAVEETIARAEAEGDLASAEAAFRVFIADPEHRRTRAHARAWLDRGDRRAVPAAARAAYAEAYVNATTVDDERDALQRLADTFIRDWNGVGLGRTAELLRDRGADDLALADLAVQAALWRGDLTTATTELARAGPRLVAWKPALQHLARATTSSATVGELELLTGEGPARLAVRDAAGTHVLLLDRALDEVGRWHDEGRIDLVPGTSWVLAQTAREARVVDLRTGAVLGRGAPDIATIAPFDATGDGVPELFFGRVWPRYGFERWDGLGRGETSVRDAHPGTDAGNSVVEAHAVGDLDGDGRDELALGFGPWRRFDLRVFRPDARGELELVAERRLGRIGGLALVHREGRPMLAVLVDNSSPAPDVFPEPPHTGGPPGLHLFEWANGTLVEADFVAFPRSDDFGRFAAHDREAVGDLDGDGREDLAFPLHRAGQPWLLLLRQTDASFEPLLVAGIELFAGAQLDDDAPIELLAALPPARQLLALGLGDAPTPTSRLDDPEPPPPVPPPLLADPWLVERWQRANDLSGLALFDSAAESLRDAALMTGDRPARSALLDRAGALFAGQDRMADVLALADDVHDDWQVRGRVQLRRAQALSRLGRHEDAFAEAEALLHAPLCDAESARLAAILVDELSALLDPAAQIDLRFDVPLAPAWQIHTPGALRRKPTRGVLELALPALGTTVAELPIDWRGGPLSLEFELDVDRLEFGAGIEISLADADGARWLGAALSGQGGGGRLQQVAWVKTGGTSWVELSEHAVASGLHRRRLAVRLTYFPAAAAANLMLANDDDVRLARLAVAAPPSPGLHHLRIGAFADSKMSSLATGELRRLVVRGAALGVARDDAGDRAARLLAEHEPRAALATLEKDGSTDPRADTLRLLAHADLGDLAGLADAVRAVLAAVDDPLRRGELVLALRRHPVAAAALRDVAGPALLPALWATWAFARPHRNDLLLRDELLEGLQELERLAPRTDAERDALRELLETRARLWERSGQPERARQDRELATALARGADTSTPSPGVLTVSSSRD